MLCWAVKSKVHLFADETIIYLVVKFMVDCLQLQQDLLSLETGNQIEKGISRPSNVVLVTRREKVRNFRMFTFKVSMGSTMEYWSFSH